MPEAYLLGGARTPVGRYGGALAAVRPDDLAALVLREAALVLREAALVLREAAQRAGVPDDLLGRMEREGARCGLATMCAGVGQGTAMIVERV